ncbi:hypothetical protein [Xanthobacter agilis]|uniref:hypothetical protein n=1 Tax=Xanthobacter agilis TaxID=47492 RepID=UPI001F1F6C16|nr:hypothetical protein [Xanthobacter agilis]
MSIAGHLDPTYLFAHEHEKRDRAWPVTRAEMIRFLFAHGDVPAAGCAAITEQEHKDGD